MNKQIYVGIFKTPFFQSHIFTFNPKKKTYSLLTLLPHNWTWLLSNVTSSYMLFLYGLIFKSINNKLERKLAYFTFLNQIKEVRQKAIHHIWSHIWYSSRSLKPFFFFGFVHLNTPPHVSIEIPTHNLFATFVLFLNIHCNKPNL